MKKDEITMTESVERVETLLALLSQTLDLAEWSDYLDDEYITDEQSKKDRDKLIDLIKEAQEILKNLIPVKEARKICIELFKTTQREVRGLK